MFEFIYDRQMVYHKKEVLKESPPWTTNQILADYKFCNVYRELDRGTKYIIKATEEIEDKRKLFFNILTYRVFNVTGLFEDIFDGYVDPNNFVFSKYENMLDDASKHRSVFSTAYIVTQMPWSHKEYRRGTKHPQFLMMLEWVAQQIISNGFMDDFDKLSPDEVFERLNSITLVGPFLAGQIMVDLSYTDIVLWGGNDFCIIGPGAAAGIEILSGSVLKYNEMVQYCKNIWEHQAIHFRNLYETTGKNWKEIAHKDSINGYPYFSLMDIQHIFCEFRKYEHWSSGKGKKKYYQHTVLNLNQGSIKEQNA